MREKTPRKQDLFKILFRGVFFCLYALTFGHLFSRLFVVYLSYSYPQLTRILETEIQEIQVCTHGKRSSSM